MQAAHTAADPVMSDTGPHVHDMSGPLRQKIEVKEIVERGGVQAMVLTALAQPTKEPLFVKHSLTIYDYQSQVVVPALHSEKVEHSVGAADKTSFEVPEGLAEGYYYAELLTAHAPHSDDIPGVSAQRLYFRVAKGEIEPLTTHDWMLATDEGEGVIEASSVELSTEADGQVETGEQQ
jgi:hypothetical protein